MADTRLAVLLQVVGDFSRDFKQATEGIREFERDNRKLVQTVRDVGIGLTAMGAVATLAIRGFASQAIEARSNMAQLRVAVENVGNSFATVQPQVEALTTSLQSQTSFAKTEMTRALALLTSVTGDFRLAIAALPSALDAAAATGQDLGTVSIQLGRVLSGQAETIRGLGIDFTSATTAGERLTLLHERLGGTARATIDPFKQLGNAFNDMRQALGEALLPTIQPIISTFKGMADAIASLPPQLLQIGGVIAVTGAAFATLAGSALLFVSQLPGMVRGLILLRDAFVAMGIAAKAAWVAALAPLALAGGLLAAIGIRFEETATSAEQSAQALENAKQRAVELGVSLSDGLRMQQLYNEELKKLKEAQDDTATGTELVIPQLGRFNRALHALATDSKETSTQVNKLGTAFSDLPPNVDQVAPAVENLRDVLKNLWDQTGNMVDRAGDFSEAIQGFVPPVHAASVSIHDFFDLLFPLTAALVENERAVNASIDQYIGLADSMGIVTDQARNMREAIQGAQNRPTVPAFEGFGGATELFPSFLVGPRTGITSTGNIARPLSANANVNVSVQIDGREIGRTLGKAAFEGEQVRAQ